MTNLDTDYARKVADRLSALVTAHKVAGASLAVLQHGEVVAEAAAGFAHIGAGIEATTETVFQIGSISKVWTATVAMQLVDAGELELDAPIRRVMPQLRLSTDELTEGVTLRHLLSHTSGIDGDFFAETGRGDDNLEKFAALLEGVAANHPLGVTQSYCNAGYSLLGRVLEVVTGVQWDQLMRERLFQPLGLTRTGTLPEEALLHRAAIGHGGDPLTPVPLWGLMRSAGPAGLIHSTPRDVLKFVKLHLDKGVTEDGTRVVSEAAAAQMLQPQVAMPDPYVLGKHWGLGWFLDEWDGAAVYGHDGGTIGQSAFLRVLPEHGLAIVLLTNGGGAATLYHQIFAEIVQELAGVTMRPPVGPSLEQLPFDPAEYVGRYERAGTHMEVQERDGKLLLIMKNVGHLAALAGEQRMELEMETFEKDVFVVMRPELGVHFPVVFYDLPDGSRYLHHGVRANPKVA
ncbi:serine hydrolase domain-containing protein [Dactylosporangium salmoneum]|uniref:Beta-lactamase-related domain-containing protein n=1 Tax=Dactylosporangium salmoneum TaxID=53361 RepID=A0ABP5TBD5_9ACTN